MHRLKRQFFSLLLLLIIPGAGIKAQMSVTGHIFAEVVPMFSATETSQMNFGRFSPGPGGGEIILTPEGTLSVIGGVYKGTGTHNAASFFISGDPNASFTITLPQAPVVLQHVSGSKTLLVGNWVSSPGPGTGSGILQGGAQTVYVGATLKVGAIEDNPIGIYAGTYTITFDFN